jgi:hypothetical protein
MTRPYGPKETGSGRWTGTARTKYESVRENHQHRSRREGARPGVCSRPACVPARCLAHASAVHAIFARRLPVNARKPRPTDSLQQRPGSMGSHWSTTATCGVAGTVTCTVRASGHCSSDIRRHTRPAIGRDSREQGTGAIDERAQIGLGARSFDAVKHTQQRGGEVQARAVGRASQATLGVRAQRGFDQLSCVSQVCAMHRHPTECPARAALGRVGSHADAGAPRAADRPVISESLLALGMVAPSLQSRPNAGGKICG